jgi:hypothetical protein
MPLPSLGAIGRDFLQMAKDLAIVLPPEDSVYLPHCSMRGVRLTKYLHRSKVEAVRGKKSSITAHEGEPVFAEFHSLPVRTKDSATSAR